MHRRWLFPRSRSRCVIDVLMRPMSAHGAPAYPCSDGGLDFVSHAILQWLADARIGTAIIDLATHDKTGTNKSFNSKFRDEFECRVPPHATRGSGHHRSLAQTLRCDAAVLQFYLLPPTSSISNIRPFVITLTEPLQKIISAKKQTPVSDGRANNR